MVGFCHSEARVDSFVNLYGVIDVMTYWNAWWFSGN